VEWNGRLGGWRGERGEDNFFHAPLTLILVILLRTGGSKGIEQSKAESHITNSF